MALEHALLVSLDERAGSGYELARRFDRSIGFFHSASHQQIYRVLHRMEDRGWVTGETVAQEGRPDKKVYRVAGAGHAELDRWVATPSEPDHLRSELAVKVRAARPGTLTELLAEITRHRDAHAARLDVYRLIEKRDFPESPPRRGPDLHQYLVLRGGIRVEEGFRDWCQDMLDALTPASEQDVP